MTIPQDQSSQEWKDWRNSHIGASDIACILGKSKWATPLQLWQRKIGFIDGIQDNWAMKRGRDLEPIVRDKFNEKKSANYEPEVLVHPELEWASASLDGIDREDGAILEIKVPGLADHQTAEMGDIPQHYYSQVQWQMFVSGVHVCFYVSFYNEQMAIVRAQLDEDYIAEILPIVAEFHKCLVEMIEPDYSEEDFVQITDPEFEHAAREWKAAAEMSKQFSDKEKHYKEKLISFTDDSNCRGYGVKLKRVARKGSIDWSRLWKNLTESFPDAASQYEPDLYRSEQIGYWKVSQDKK